MKRGLIWTFIIITIIASIQSRHPGEAVSLQASSNTQHKGLAVNQRTHDPGPVLAESELSLQGQGAGLDPQGPPE